MRKVVLLTDLGSNAFELAQLKAAFHASSFDYQLVELSNTIAAQDIIEGHFFINTLWQNFISNTVFVISIGLPDSNGAGYMVAECQEKLFIAADNGLLPLMFNGLSVKYWSLGERVSFENSIQTLIKHNFTIDKQWSEVKNPIEKIIELPMRTDTVIRSSIVHIDGFGNAYIPLSKAVFLEHTMAKQYVIQLKRDEMLNSLSEGFNDVTDGDGLAFFDNSDNFLIIAVKKGNAAGLFGLRKGQYIFVQNIN